LTYFGFIVSFVMEKIKQIKGLHIFKRDIIDKVLPWIGEREAVVITGARRVGKTYLMYSLAKEIGKRIFFFDLEQPEDFDIVSSGPEAVAKFTGGGYIFIDEIQYLKNFPKFIKLIVDHYSDIELFCSGSSMLSITKGLSQELVGRVVQFELTPLSFSEFLRFKKEERYLSMINSYDFEVSPKLNKLFEEFLLYGGYPEIALLDSKDKKISYLSNMFRIYAKRDISTFFEVKREVAFENFFHVLSNSVGSILNILQVSSDIGVSPKTLDRYLRILSDMYLVRLIPPFVRSARTEIRKAKKVYFNDTGLLNWARGNFSPMTKRGDAGSIAENLALLSIERKANPGDSLYYWRKKSGAEVNFIILGDGVIPVESKWSNNIKLGRGFRSFIKRYHPGKGTVLTKNVYKKEILNNTEVIFIPLLFFDIGSSNLQEVL